MYPAYVTTPAATGLIPVPFDVDISRPVCVDDLDPPLEPNLEETDPFTGIANANPFKLPVGPAVVVVAKLLALAAAAFFFLSSSFLFSY